MGTSTSKNGGTFLPISSDEEELLSLLSMEGANMYVIGLWGEQVESTKKPLESIRFDTTCYISDDGKALVCEMDVIPENPLDKSSSTMAQKRSNGKFTLDLWHNHSHSHFVFGN